jgi:hypothetical protein
MDFVGRYMVSGQVVAIWDKMELAGLEFDTFGLDDTNSLQTPTLVGNFAPLHPQARKRLVRL